ncbi:MAG: aminopeptidase P family protein [Candidatus Gracilibacteria bacterium]
MKLITHLTNVRYLSGFTGTHGFMLLGSRKNYFFTDFRYRGYAEELEKSKTRIPFKFIEINKEAEKDLKKLLGKKLEFEAAHLSLQELQFWKKRLKGISFIPNKNPIEDLRLCKDKEEIKNLKKSQTINEETLKRIIKLFKDGVTELELAWKIRMIGHELGAEDVSFEPIIAFGSHSAIPHHQNTNKKLKMGDVVLIDMGMKYKGYCSDMTRTFFTKKPTAEQESVFSKVLTAQLEAIKALKSGVKCSKLDQIARKSMGEEAEFFGHSLGHGIGLDIHESPRLNTRSKDTLKENMIVTVEPGIYLPGRFGVRIEDMGRVTKTGYENFTRFEKLEH